MPAVICVVIFFGFRAGAAAQISHPGNDKPVNAAHESSEAAQAEYYGELTKKLREPPPPPKTISELMRDNFVGAMALCGAVLAASISLMSFVFNYRAQLRNQVDTQFYEALKRSGDKDSGAVRASAAALIAQVGKRRKSLSWQWSYGFLSLPRLALGLIPELRRLIIFRRAGFRSGLQRSWERLWHFQQFPYLETAFNQLLTNLMLESEPIILYSIRDALLELIGLAPVFSSRRCYETNLRIRDQLVGALPPLFAADGAADAGAVEPAAWERASSATGLPVSALRTLLQRQPRDTEFAFRLAAAGVDPAGSQLKQLELLGHRVRIVVDLVGRVIDLLVISKGLPNRVQFSEAFLPSLDVADGAMSRIDFDKACLDRANFSKCRILACSFHEATLVSSDFAGSTCEHLDFRGADLLRSNFSRTSIRDVNCDNTRFDQADVSDADLSRLSENAAGCLAQTNWWAAQYWTDRQLRGLRSDLLDALSKLTPPGAPSACSDSVRKYFAMPAPPDS